MFKGVCKKDDFPCDDQQLAIADMVQGIQLLSLFVFLPAGVVQDYNEAHSKFVNVPEFFDTVFERTYQSFDV